MAKNKPDPMDIFVGTRVKMARNLANMSQETLGLALGVTYQQVQKYEKGVNRISSSKMQKIATTLKRPVSWFFDEQPNGKAKAEGADVVTQMLSTAVGVQLATSFVAIKSNKDRHVIADIADAFAQHA